MNKQLRLNCSKTISSEYFFFSSSFFLLECINISLYWRSHLNCWLVGWLVFFYIERNNFLQTFFLVFASFFRPQFCRIVQIDKIQKMEGELFYSKNIMHLGWGSQIKKGKKNILIFLYHLGFFLF